jgi:hypothetical protein
MARSYSSANQDKLTVTDSLTASPDIFTTLENAGLLYS